MTALKLYGSLPEPRVRSVRDLRQPVSLGNETRALQLLLRMCEDYYSRCACLHVCLHV